jgi:predicted outer membrane protein
MKRIGVLSFALVAALSGGCSPDKGKTLGQGKAGERTSPGTSVPADMVRQDAKDFLHHVAIVNVAEIEFGKMARDRGTAAEVKKVGRMMIHDHSASARALESSLKKR